MSDFTVTPALLESVAKLPKSQRAGVMGLIGKQEFQRCADDPIYWLNATSHMATSAYPAGLPYVYTKDPHKIYTCKECGVEEVEDRRVIHNETVHGKMANTLRSLIADFVLLPAIRPFTLMDYMPPIIQAWQQTQYFALEKSRDMMATWLLIALHTWDAMFHEGRQYIFQSEDAFKTLELVQRAELIYRQTPKFLRDIIGGMTFAKGGAKSGELFFTDMKSEILGFPQGPDQIRQFHPSGVFSDECAFQLEAGPTFAAIKPAIMMGGKYTAISSANRSWFELVVRDRIEESQIA